MLRGPAARTHRICWLAISMIWPLPITAEQISRPSADDQSAKPAQAVANSAEPIQVVWASWPRSMKRPTRTAIRIGTIANADAISPSQTIDSLSSTAR